MLGVSPPKVRSLIRAEQPLRSNATFGGQGKAYLDHDIILALWQDGKNIYEIHKITNYDEGAIRKVLKSNNISKNERFMRGQLAKQSPIAMLDKDTKEILRVFSSLREAHDFLGKQQNGHIAAVCNEKTQGGIWIFLEKIIM